VSITDDQDAFERQLHPSARIKRIHEIEHILEVLAIPVTAPYGDDGVVDIVHDAGLEEVLQELMVRVSPPSLDLDDCLAHLIVRVGAERLVDRAVPAEKDRDIDLLAVRLSLLDPDVQRFQVPAQYLQDLVAALFVRIRGDLALVVSKDLQYRPKPLRSAGASGKELALDHGRDIFPFKDNGIRNQPFPLIIEIQE